MLYPKTLPPPMSILRNLAAGIMVDSSRPLKKQLVPFDDLSYGRFRDTADALFIRVSIN